MGFSTQASVTSGRSVQECLDATQRAMSSAGMTPKVEGNEVQGKKGSALQAYFLGFLASPSVMPVKVRGRVSDGGMERTVNISAEDAYPIPIKIFISGKIRKQCEATLEAVRAALDRELSDAPEPTMA